METNVMGGWLQISGGDVEIHDLVGSLDGTIVYLAMERVYMLVKQVVAPEESVGCKWQFIVLPGRGVLPDKFTVAGSEWVKLDAMLQGRIDIGGLSSAFRGRYDLANALLLDALTYVKPGMYSIGRKEEWKQIVKGHLKRAGIESFDQ